jgi:hypothetical protein
MQPRYKFSHDEMVRYMEEEAALGYPVHGMRHLQSSFIIYNMNHPDTLTIQNMWKEHTDRLGGLMCQISFYFVAQRFPTSVQEYTLDWQMHRYKITIA